MSLRKKVSALGLVGALVISMLAGCGGSGSGKTQTVTFMFGGDATLTEMFTKAAQEFNDTVGKKEGITIKTSPKSGSIDSVLAQQLPGNSGPDVVCTSDKYFKKYTQYFVDLADVISEEAQNEFYENPVGRYRYNIETTTSNKTDPLYGIPAYNDAAVLYYNKTVLEEAGVVCISVDEEDLDDFNKGGKDANGKTKKDLGIEDVTVLAKGYYRSGTPYVADGEDFSGSSWVQPDGETLIFNDRIAMNWDEVEDIAMLCTKAHNSDSPSEYGYYTEWWFNYGWSVGGDCLEDLSGEGDWTYTLASDNPNYIVGEGKTYTGVYTGTKYEAGETLDFKDVIEAKAGDKISYETDEETYYTYTVNGSQASVRDFSAEVADGTLTKLPSIREALSRFMYLAGEGGSNVAPYPSVFSSTSSASYFGTGELAFLIEYVSSAATFNKILADEWGMAPLPAYKTYTEPKNPNCDTVASQGKASAHSLGYAVSVSAKSEVKDAACTFVEWLATDGQQVLAENGYVSSRKCDADLVLEKLPYTNAAVVLRSVANSSAGDWWYLLDNVWIDTWATPLNSQVRYGKLSLDEFLYGYVEKTNTDLKTYK